VIAVVDYGVNNLRSVVRAFEAGGHRATLTADPDQVRSAERVLVPGVGNFGQGTRNLASTGLGDAVREVAAAGRVRRFGTTLHVPHVGWARVDLTEAGREHPMLGPLFAGEPQFFYHVHSYHPSDLPGDSVLGTGEYGARFPTLVGRGAVIGAQFHPEKSQRAGIELLGAFARWAP
jgi:imidazoleglycerol phosphate synthase glutamine amidotransferase subunit HisH